MESDKAEKPPAETPPDHLFIDPKHSYYNEAILNRGIGIRFNGAEKTNVADTA